MQNTGSFGAATGGVSPELQAAMASRGPGMSPPAPTQTTGTAPTNNPQTQVPPISTAAPMTSGPSPSGGPGPSLEAPPQLPFGSAEAKIGLGAIKNYLSAIAKFHGV